VVSEASGVPLCALRTHLRGASLPPQALFLEVLGEEAGGGAAETPGGHAAWGGGAGGQRARACDTNSHSNVESMSRGSANASSSSSTRASASVLTRHDTRASVLAAAARRTAHMRKKRSEVVRAEDAEDVARREAQAANIGRLFFF
jgi:hypothetical protein